MISFFLASVKVCVDGGANELYKISKENEK
jgi:thiamine pyrophosphokinase